MISLDRQRATQAALRQLDEAMTVTAAAEEKLQKQSLELRDQLFGAFQFIERESLQGRTLLVQTNRIEASLLQVQVRGRPPLDLLLDAEPAYDHKNVGGGKPELCTRVYALFAPPQRGVLRHYTVFATGEWKRTVFVSRGGATSAHPTLLPAINSDALLEEATDLLAQLCSVHATWNTLAEDPATVSLDQLRDRQFVKRDPLGLG